MATFPGLRERSMMCGAQPVTMSKTNEDINNVGPETSSIDKPRSRERFETEQILSTSFLKVKEKAATLESTMSNCHHWKHDMQEKIECIVASIQNYAARPELGNRKSASRTCTFHTDVIELSSKVSKLEHEKRAELEDIRSLKLQLDALQSGLATSSCDTKIDQSLDAYEALSMHAHKDEKPQLETLLESMQRRINFLQKERAMLVNKIQEFTDIDIRYVLHLRANRVPHLGARLFEDSMKTHRAKILEQSSFKL